MATFSNNTTMKIQGAVNYSGTASTTNRNTLILTVPANQYAILSIFASTDGGAAGHVVVGTSSLTGVNIQSANQILALAVGTGAAQGVNAPAPIYVGPGISLYWGITMLSTNARLSASGIIYANTP